ncbi:MAG: hypothetical protein JWM11_717 [Planctomycetaceae bacterium]|nr:hypothetical protein [Planctomycetaceae bacterium]
MIRTMSSIRQFTCFCLLLVGSLANVNFASAEVKLLAQGQFSGTASDKSGLIEVLRSGNERIPHNRMGGFSAIAYTGKNDLYWGLEDRGPLDGATPFACRVQLIKISQQQPGQTLQV